MYRPLLWAALFGLTFFLIVWFAIYDDGYQRIIDWHRRKWEKQTRKSSLSIQMEKDGFSYDLLAQHSDTEVAHTEQSPTEIVEEDGEEITRKIE